MFSAAGHGEPADAFASELTELGWGGFRVGYAIL